MKKIKSRISIFLALALIYLINPVEIFAADYRFNHNRVNSCVNDGTCTLWCGYTNEKYTKAASKQDWIVYSSYIYYSNTENKFFVEAHLSDQNRKKFDWNSNSVFKSSHAINKLKAGECPANSYIDNDGLSSEICFDDNSGENGYCVSQDPGGIGTTFSGTSILEYDEMAGINLWFDKWSYGSINCPEDVIGLDDKEAFKEMLKERYIYDWNNYRKEKKIPDFVTNIAIQKFDNIYENNYGNFYNSCVKEIDEAEKNGDITKEEADKAKENITITEEDQEEINEGAINSAFGDAVTIPQYSGEYICGIFGEKTWGYIKMLYTLIRIAIPAIVIILGMVDFASVVFSGEDKDMKAAGQKFLKRIIVGIVFILLPSLIIFIIDLVGFSENCLQHLG